MKTSVAVTIVVLLVFICLGSAIAKSPTIKLSHRKKLSKGLGKVAPAPKFKLTKAMTLQRKLKKVSPFVIGKKILGSLMINEAYKNGEGVYLSAGHPRDEASQSNLSVVNVQWNDFNLRNLDKNRDEFAISQILGINEYKPTASAAAAEFRQTSNIDCLYLLSFGTTIAHNALLLRVQGKDVPRSKIYYNSSAHEYYTFVRAAGLGNGRQIFVHIATDKRPSANSDLAYFHHIRLKYMKVK